METRIVPRYLQGTFEKWQREEKLDLLADDILKLIITRLRSQEDGLVNIYTINQLIVRILVKSFKRCVDDATVESAYDAYHSFCEDCLRIENEIGS